MGRHRRVWEARPCPLFPPLWPGRSRSETPTANLAVATRLLALYIAPLIVNPPGSLLPPLAIPSEPVVNTFETMLDIGSFLNDNLNVASPAPPYYQPIGILKILNLKNSWLVMTSGLYPFRGTDNATGLRAAIAAGLGFVNSYQKYIVLAIQKVVPPGANLFLVGLSLGGMCVEGASYILSGYNQQSVITLASPPIPVSGTRPCPITRFAVVQDLVPLLSVFGLFSFGGFGLVGYYPRFGYTIIAADPENPEFWQCHGYFPYNPACRVRRDGSFG